MGLFWCIIFNLSVTLLLSENNLQALPRCSSECLESVLEKKYRERGGS